MKIGIIDAIILLFILLGGVVGFKEGVIKKLTSVIGLILVIILAFNFKNQLSVFFYENLPFFNLWGVFKGIQVLNIVFYELLAFVVIAGVLFVAYNAILALTGLIEKILKATVILSIPSKILGFIVGLIEGYIITYIILFILVLPMINIKAIYTSDTANYILKNTPVLSNYTNESIKIYNELSEVINNRADKTDSELNQESIELMLKYKFITLESAQKLIRSNKVYVEDDSFLNKYNK